MDGVSPWKTRGPPKKGPLAFSKSPRSKQSNILNTSAISKPKGHSCGGPPSWELFFGCSNEDKKKGENWSHCLMLQWNWCELPKILGLTWFYHILKITSIQLAIVLVLVMLMRTTMVTVMYGCRWTAIHCGHNAANLACILNFLKAFIDRAG